MMEALSHGNGASAGNMNARSIKCRCAGRDDMYREAEFCLLVI